MYRFEVLDPTGVAPEVSGHPAPRPTTLDRLIVGLVWNKKRGGLEALKRTGDLVGDRYRSVTLRTYEGGQPCAKELLEQASRECDVFVGATGD